MFEQIITLLCGTRYMNIVTRDINALAEMFEHYLAHADSVRIMSIGLIVGAFSIFLLMIVVLYIKSLFSFIKSESNKEIKQIEEPEDEEDISDNEQNQEYELERQLAQELEMSLAQKNQQEQQEQQEQEQQELWNQQTQEQQQESQTHSPKQAPKQENKLALDLDWKKGQKTAEDFPAEPLDPAILRYHQSQKTLDKLLGLIINMLGRGVDELKIAQTIMYRNQGKNSEEDIIQLIDSIKEFVSLCVSGKFKGLISEKTLPREDESLFHLANGDASLALALIEALMDNQIEQSMALPLGDKRDKIFKETSAYAVNFGTLATLSDMQLANSSFELSVELFPQNVTAWSRLGDMYYRLSDMQKAVWAYQQVLDMGDEDLQAQSIANANKFLSQYYYAQGNSLQAAKLYNQSKQFYDSIGINRRLDRKEIEIIELIESKQQDDLEATIKHLLNNKSFAHNR